MKKVAIIGLLLCTVFYAYGADGRKTIPLTLDSRTGKVTNTYANSQIDTVIYNPPAGLSGLTFAMHGKDSLVVLTIKVRRVFDGAVMAQIAADTLDRAIYTWTTNGNPGSGSFNDGGSAGASVTLTPHPDQYLFIVTYATTLNGVTSPTVVYEGIQQLSKKP